MVTFYVHITEKCRQDAKKRNSIEEIEALAQKIEKVQHDFLLNNFPKPYRTSYGRKGVLVISEHQRNNIRLFCFVRYLKYDSSEHKLFRRDPRRHYEYNKTELSEVDHVIAQKQQNPIKPKPPVSDVERYYLQPSILYQYGSDGAILESKDWVERITQHWAQRLLYEYYELIVEIVSSTARHPDTLISHKDNSEARLVFRRFPQHRRTFLIAPLNPEEPEDDEDDIRRKYIQFLESNDVTYEVLTAHSRRAYPISILGSFETWLKIMQGDKANLALSPEEEAVMTSVLSSSGTQKRYPLFINGRAGSGKSTVLQYLFADHLLRFMKSLSNADEVNINVQMRGENDLRPPLYLTYSNQLRTEALSTVKDILICNGSILESGVTIPAEEKLQSILNESFRSFRPFLKSLLPGKLGFQFSMDRYMSFYTFRKQWNDKRRKHPDSSVRDIGSELAWHVIRTFIKGSQRGESGSVIDPQCYRFEIEQKNKTISDEMFSIIYNHVWKKWYEPLCQLEGYWDDQDLVRFVLTHAEDQLPRHPVVFCDESQDFTRIELELIEQLSVYSARDLPSYLAKDVPFAFAGDPFQTINPTGFNWNVLQSSFHEKIARQLDPNNEANLKFNFKELSLNYRSSEDIVKLLNLIQLLRAVLIDIKDVVPQTSWQREETGSLPVSYDWSEEDCQFHLQQQREIVVIVPCQEDGEMEYVKNDSLLKKIAIRPDRETGEDRLRMNVLSPARAKGLEFERVLVYGFGQKALEEREDLVEQLQNYHTEALTLEKKLLLEYFITNLYVAASRARKRLFIVDSKESFREFWSFSEERYAQELLSAYNVNMPQALDDLSNDTWTIDDLGKITKGDNQSWYDEKDDQLTIARQFKSKGIASRDSYLLERARTNFEDMEEVGEALVCEALVHEYEHRYKEAAQIFRGLDLWEDACRCYWAKKDAFGVLELADSFPQVTEDIRFLAASVITRQRNTALQIRYLLSILEDNVSTSLVDERDDIASWRWFFNRFISKIVEFVIDGGARNVTDEEICQEWRNDVVRLILLIERFEFLDTDYPGLARLLYLVGNSNAAIDLWKRCQSREQHRGRLEESQLQNIDTTWVDRAYAEVEPYPVNIEYYYKVSDFESVIEQWINNGRRIDGKAPVRYWRLLDSATILGDLESVIRLLPVCTEMSQIADVLTRLNTSAVTELSGAFAVAIANSLTYHRKWNRLVEFASEDVLEFWYKQKKVRKSKTKVSGSKQPKKKSSKGNHTHSTAHATARRSSLEDELNFSSKNEDISESDLSSGLGQLQDKLTRKIRLAATVRAIARTDRFEKSRSKVARNEIPEILRKALVVEEDNKLQNTDVKAILQLISIEEGGSAIERVIRLKKASQLPSAIQLSLQFYEQFFMTGGLGYQFLRPTKKQVSFARQRWLACQYRLANSKVMKEQDRDIEVKDTANSRAEQWGISVDYLNTSYLNYPELPTLAAITIPSEEELVEDDSPMALPILRKSGKSGLKKIMLGSCEVSVTRINHEHKILLTDLKTSSQIECQALNVVSKSGDLRVEENKRRLDGGEWIVPHWQMICETQTSKAGTVILLRHVDRSLIDKFEFYSGSLLRKKER